MQEYQTTSAQRYPTIPLRSLPSNIILLLLSAGLIVWSLRFMQAKATSISSVDAVVNGTITDVRASQDGKLADVKVKTGDEVTQDALLATLVNDRVSQLKTQELTTRINQLKSEVTTVEASRDRYLALLNSVADDAQTQQRLEISDAQQQVAQLVSDLEGAQARQELAERNYARNQSLHAEGALTQANLDSSAVEVRQRRSEVSSLEAQLQRLQANREAASTGLSLSRTPSNYDPRIRRDELQLKIADEQRRIDTLQQQIKDTQAELTQAKADQERQKSAQLKAPQSGVIWKWSAQSGKVLQKGDELGQIADCRSRWVDAIVDEQAVRSLQVGTEADLQLYGAQSSVVLRGKVTMIRSGMGRLEAGEDVKMPISPNAPRHSQVRVVLDDDPQTTASDPASEKKGGNFCYIGYTGRVTFKAQQNFLPALF